MRTRTSVQGHTPVGTLQQATITVMDATEWRLPNGPIGKAPILGKGKGDANDTGIYCRDDELLWYSKEGPPIGHLTDSALVL